MILTTGDEVRYTGQYRHKFDPAMAEYLYCYQMHGGDYSGHCDAPTGWWAVDGRRILRGDDRGAVWVETYPNVGDAREEECKLEDEYSAWAEENKDQ